jgi:4-hydroxy-4-methyl-2-oxoglutarate aldolase
LNLISRQNIVDLTPNDTLPRDDYGRPMVPDDILDRIRKATTEEAWGVLNQNGYHHQFEGDWLNLHPDRILVGRAVTGRFVPARPDLNEVVEEEGKANGRIGGQNSWVIDTLEKGDVIVIELFGKIIRGTFAGDNLATAINTRTQGAGMVVDGGMRDYQRVLELDDFNGYIKGLDPTGIGEVTLTEINGPVRIGNATVLPGDVVLGTPAGVIFIPPHLAETVAQRSEAVRLRDFWGKLMISEGKYTPGEIDRKWPDEIESDFAAWCETHSLEDIDS